MFIAARRTIAYIKNSADHTEINRAFSQNSIIIGIELLNKLLINLHRCITPKQPMVFILDGNSEYVAHA